MLSQAATSVRLWKKEALHHHVLVLLALGQLYHLSPLPPTLSSASSASKPICSALAIIMCLPSLWHIIGRRQASLSPLSSSSSPSSHPYFRAHFTSSLKGPGGITSRFLSKGWKQRSSNGNKTKALKRRICASILLRTNCPMPTGSVFGCCWFLSSSMTVAV